MKKFDAIIIGSGQAGNPLAKHIADKGKKVAIIERELLGGTCINYGCTPTKTMIASARNIYQARRGKEYGFDSGDITIRFQDIMKRKDGVVTEFRAGTEKGLKGNENIEIIYGEAKFSGAKQIVVHKKTGDAEELTADYIFINTGNRTAIPDLPGLKDVAYLTSTDMLALNELPEHLIIIGASYIALEFGQMFRRFGSKITMLERSSRFLSKEDEDVADEIKKIMTEDGIDIITDAKADSVQRQGDQIAVSVTTGNNKKTLTGTHLLLAAGRTPNSDMLDLDKAGIETDEKGFIKVNDKLETNVKGIYALGDVKGGPAFTHISYNDYLIVYKNIYENASLSVKERPVPYCIFIDPELGRIGITEQDAKQQGLHYKVAKLKMTSVGRAIETGETRGFMKAIVDADSKQILGASVLAVNGGELMSMLELAMMGKLTYTQLREAVFAHPTFAESLNNLFMNLDK